MSNTIIPIGQHSGHHWTMQPSPHFTRPEMKPYGMGYTWFGANQGYGCLEQTVIRQTVQNLDRQYPLLNLERFVSLDPTNITNI